MTRRLALVALLACGGENAAAPGVPMPPVVHEDVVELGRRIVVPPPLARARWAVRPKGAATGGLPGPTDLCLLAWFPLAASESEALPAVLGASRQDGDLPIDVALEKVLPDEVLAALPRQDGRAIARGPTFPTAAFENVRWEGGRAVRIEGGLVVELHSRP